MTHPPMKCAVSGMSTTADTLPPGMARTPVCRVSAAHRARTPVLAWGNQVGLGSPWPWREVSRTRPRRPRRPRTVSELSRDCMTSATTVRCDQRRTDRLRTKSPGWRAASATNRSGRGTRPSASTMSVASSPMRLDPLP